MRRVSAKQWSLKPQDLAVAMKLLLLRDKPLSYAALAEAMHLSPYEAHAAVQRLVAARLIVETAERYQLAKEALREFLMHGARYAFPPVVGEPTVGVPTAHAMEPLAKHFRGGNDLPPVWPHPQGEVRGVGLLPLYPRLSEAALDDPELHQFLALFDALRIGRARERKLAADLIEKRFE